FINPRYHILNRSPGGHLCLRPPAQGSKLRSKDAATRTTRPAANRTLSRAHGGAACPAARSTSPSSPPPPSRPHPSPSTRKRPTPPPRRHLRKSRTPSSPPPASSPPTPSTSAAAP